MKASLAGRPARTPGRIARACAIAMLALGLAGCVVLPVVGALAEQEVQAAVVAKLEGSVSDALQVLGAPGRIESDPALHVPLPPTLRLVQPMLELAGFGPQLQRLDHQINQTEERVATVAFPIYSQVIRATHWPQDAAEMASLLSTPRQSLERLAGAELKTRILPLVEAQAREVGLDRTWQQLEAARPSSPASPDDSAAALHAYLADRFVAVVAQQVGAAAAAAALQATAPASAAASAAAPASVEAPAAVEAPASAPPSGGARPPGPQPAVTCCQ